MLDDLIKKWKTSPIEALQHYLAQLGYGGMIIPHVDSFQNAPYAPHSNRLKAILGFGGSAGLGMVLGKRAALFVDGRYILEAQQLISPALEVFLWTQDNIKAFLSKGLVHGEKTLLVYDPLLFTKKNLEDMQKLAGQVEFSLKPLDANPIDALSGITCHKEDCQRSPYIYIQGEEDQPFHKKCDTIAQQIGQKGCSAFFVSSPESLNWLLNVRGVDLTYTPLFLARGLLYSNGEVAVFTDHIIPPEMKAYFGTRVTFLPCEELNTSLSQVVGGLWADPTTTPSALASYMESHCRIFWASDPCILPKAIRGGKACEQIDLAHKRDGAALSTVFKELLDPDQDHSLLSESELAKMVDESRRRLDLYVSSSFQTIVGFGAHGAIIHYHPFPGADQRLGQNELVLVDSGAQYLDGTTDVTRTLWVGSQRPPLEMVEAYTLVLKGHIALASVIFPKGTTGAQLEVLARQFLWRKGLDYYHGTGHGVGHFMNVHEGPQGISQRGAQVPLVPGMVVSNEPGFYPEGAFGVRLENLMLVVEAGEKNFYQFKTLTRVPYQSCLIDLDKLTKDELKWLNAYHQEVLKTIGPLVSQEVFVWLKDQTSPLC